MKKPIVLLGLWITASLFIGCAKTQKTTTAAESTAKSSNASTPSVKETGTPSAADEKTQTSSEPVAMEGIVIHEVAACRAVQDKMPIESGTTFPGDIGRIYLFSRIGMQNGGEGSIKHIWYFHGDEVATVTLPVRGSAWRTYSSKSVQSTQKGDWRVDVASTEGVVLHTVSFKVE